MDGILQGAGWSQVLAGAFSAATPLVLAATGGLFTELSGMLNISLEGLMTFGALFAALGAQATGSHQAGVAAGAAAGTALSLLYAAACLRLRANVFVAGLATNLLASGLAVVLSQEFFGTKAVFALRVPSLAVPFAALRDLPLAGPALFSQNLLTLGAWAILPIAWTAIRATPFGLRLRASGSNPQSLRSAGLSPDRYRLAAIIASGALCGLAGAHLSLNLAAHVPNISSGRGWIALVAVYLGGRRPAGIALACLAFAAAESFSNFAQGFLDIPADFILAIPYAVTLAALVAGALARPRSGPSSRR